MRKINPDEKDCQLDVSIYDWLGTPNAAIYPYRENPTQEVIQQDQVANKAGPANMQWFLKKMGPDARINQPNFADWYVPNLKPITYNSVMPMGMFGYYDPSSDAINVHPTAGFDLGRKGYKDLAAMWNPIETYIHELTHREDRTKEKGWMGEPQLTRKDLDYFPKGKDLEGFIGRMLDVLGYDDFTKDNFYANYPSIPQRMDEMRARLMARDAVNKKDDPIWERMRPHDILWFLDTTRSGWNPKEPIKAPAGRLY